ncbi:hypothetical protein FGO68_gene11385 [Halteria grandinella]|uniref:Uncharacterized protein n=1 Tax=Halteria grandinella TaxID=5974 RepID=A0A8J8P4E0_HALGN|nr:hypothetical protein FGO68_gene11385 [Halteria grandinella]
MRLLPPMIVSGPKLVDSDRVVLWRQQAMIGDDLDESLVEISKNKHRMFIISYHSISMRFQVIEMFRQQGKKLLQACEESFTKLIELLEYRYGFFSHFKNFQQHQCFKNS